MNRKTNFVPKCQGTGPKEGKYGVNIPKGVWHTIEALAPNSVIFECKEGPFVEHEEEGVMRLQR